VVIEYFPRTVKSFDIAFKSENGIERKVSIVSKSISVALF